MLINSVVNAVTCVLDATAINYENLINFFQDEVDSVRLVTGCNEAPNFSVAIDASVVLEEFEAVFLATLTDVQHMKFTNCPLDVLPSKFLKNAFNIVSCRSYIL